MNQKQKPSTWRVLLALLLWAAPAALQAQYNYTTNADGVSITITGYTGSGGALTIPTNINGLTVTGIGQEAFFESYRGCSESLEQFFDFTREGWFFRHPSPIPSGGR